MKNKFRSGFTIIEVMLVLAITAALFAGLVVNVSGNIATQRYATTVQGFVSFIKQVYSQVENTQINLRGESIAARTYCTIDAGVANAWKNLEAGTPSGAQPKTQASGRTNCSVYGKLVVFGDSINNNNGNAVYVYDVIGTAIDLKHPLSAGINTEIDAYQDVKMGIFALENSRLVTNFYRYNVEWGGYVQNTDGDTLKAAVLIVRSPLSGTIHTYTYVDPNQTTTTKYDIQTAYNLASSSNIADNNGYSPFNSGGEVAKLSANLGGFSNANSLNFCIESADRRIAQRRNIRLTPDAHSSLDIIVVDQDGGDNQCVL